MPLLRRKNDLERFLFNMELANGRSVFAGLKNQRFWFNSKRLHKIYLRVVRMA